jgi:hypothetical protein
MSPTACALRAPTVFSARMKSASAQKTRLLFTTRTVRGVCTSSIGAARCVLQHPAMFARDHCALRAPTVFSVRIKTIRTENTVIVDNKDGAGVCTRSQIRNNRSAIAKE